MTLRYVFVGGLHRSGTSLVARWLASHPAVAGFRDTGVWEDEGQHLQDALLPARLLGGPGRFARHPGALGELLPEDSVVPLRERLLRTWAPLWDDRPVRVAKSPPNLLRGPLLQQLFPGSVLVVVRRHPIAVALATRRMGRRFAGRDLVELVEHWAIAHELFEGQRPRLGALVEFEHADLVRRPEAIAPMFESLEIDPVPPPERLVDTDAIYRREWGDIMRSRREGPALRQALEGLSDRVLRLGYRLDGFDRDSGPLRGAFSTR